MLAVIVLAVETFLSNILLTVFVFFDCKCKGSNYKYVKLVAHI